MAGFTELIRNRFIEKIILPIGDLFLKGNFSKKIKFWRKFTSYNELELKDYQDKQLKKILIHAINNIDKYKNIKYIESETSSILLKKFPILTKDDLRTNVKHLILKNKEKTFKISSSGSTGVSSFVYMNMKELTSLQSLSIHLWELCGYKIGNPVIQTGISPKRTNLKKLKDCFFNTIYIPAFSLTNKDLHFISKKLMSNNNYTVIGYPSSINIIADYIAENNLKISASKVIALGDALLPKYKVNIEKYFHCKVFETYGSSEGFQIGFQVDLDYMYQFSPQTYLELLDDDNNPVNDGEIGNVVVTRLDNRYMPLIRYKLGDLAIKLPKDKYPKKRKFNFPLLEKVVGRNTDIIILPDNKKLIVHSFTGIFEYIEEIKQFKIIQKNRTGIIIEYIPTNHNVKSEVIKSIKHKLQEFILDEEFLIEFKKVDKISSKNSGKPQIIESFLKDNNE